MSNFRRDPNPPHVTYHVWLAMQNLVNTDNSPVPLAYQFDKAYWVRIRRGIICAIIPHGSLLGCPVPMDCSTEAVPVSLQAVSQNWDVPALPELLAPPAF